FRKRIADKGVLGIRVLWFERAADGGFVSPHDWSDNAMATTSTHDVPTVAGWWSGRDVAWRKRAGLDDPEVDEGAQREADRHRLWSALCASGSAWNEDSPPAPDDISPVVVAAARHVAQTPAPLAIFPVEDVLGLHEQPNLPGPTDAIHPNWRRRMPDSSSRLFDGPIAHAVCATIDQTRNRTHLYASPILRARAGSMHGYDVVDCHQVSPEIGGEEGLRRLVAALRSRGMGLIVDIVPNHMGVGPENAWWMDVLRHGRESRYAGHFDIDWQSPDPLLRGRLLLPILGAGYDTTLREGHLRLVRRRDEWMLRIYDDHLPLSPASTRALGHDALATHDVASEEGRAHLHALIEKQHYRLAFWKLASDMVNYRRFFDINELAGLRIERTAVFEDTHRTIFRLYAEGLIDGVRCDHVDGLADPRRYCRQLRHRFERLRAQRPGDAWPGAAYVV
ncbi:hypothetical protein KCV01_g23359, partial [Aureobasidium melanogenum]